MIDVLKNRVEKKIGGTIKTRGDCELLSNAITETLDIDISYNTLRRMYGLVPYTKPNTKTLNTLSQFVGYKNYADFSQNQEYKEKIDLSRLIYKAVYVNNQQAVLELIKKTKNSNENFISFIVILTRELIHNKNYRLLDEIFKLKALNFFNFSYSDALYLGNSIGLLLRQKPKIPDLLLKNTNFVRCIYLTFVDYSFLNGYYGEWTKVIVNTKPKLEVKIFSSLLLEFRNFLNQKSVKEIKLNLSTVSKLHPILSSRLVSNKFLISAPVNTIKVLDDYFKIHTQKSTRIDHCYELFTTAILTKNLTLMEYLIKEINLNNKAENYYQKYHLNSFYLMNLFYFKLTKNNKMQKKYNGLFSVDACLDSYEDFIIILHQIYLFGAAKTHNNKEVSKKKYTQLSAQLNFALFSEDFLQEYFD